MKKFLKISIVAILLVCVMNTIVNALSFSVIMTPSNKVVPASTEFTVEFKVSNLDVGVNGINALSGKLEYDKNVFEVIGESSIEGRNDWKHTFNAENEGKITLTNMNFVKTEEEIFQVTFKTKAGLADNTKGIIKFKGITAANSASEIPAADVSVEITIGKEDTPGGTISPTPTNTNANKVTNTNTNNKTNTNTNISTNKTINTANTNKTTNTNTPVTSYSNTTNTTKEDIPYAGTEDYMLYFIGAVVAIAIVFYIKFERINKEIK